MGQRTEYAYDVFISYCHADEAWVGDELLPRLERAGISCVDQLQFEAGRPELDEIERVIKESRRTLLILTPSYLEDNWRRFDSILVGSYDLDIGEWRAIPVILQSCKLPTRLRALVAIDLRAGYENSWRRLIDSILPSVRQEDPPDLHIETPTGAVPPDSPLYIERHADAQLLRQLKGLGTVTTIHGAHGTGKSTLLSRGIDYAKRQGALVIFVSFEAEIASSQLENLDLFLRSLAHQIAGKPEVIERTEISHSIVDSIWKEPSYSSKNKMTKFVERILTGVSKLVLTMDEVDTLLDRSFYREFFGLLRAWHNKRALNSLWRKLNIVMAISTHPFLLIDDIHQSPFNVGLSIRLDDFSEAQVQDLNQRYGRPFGAAEVSAIVDLLGGHPYLIRRAFYVLVDEKSITWPDLMTVAARSDGPFDQYLHKYLDLLHRDSGLEEAMCEILKKQTCSVYRLSQRLRMAGLVREYGRKLICRYDLYEDFFRSQLLKSSAQC